MNCPACHKPTRRTRNGQCIHCRVELEVFTYRKNREEFKEFRLVKPEDAVEIIHKVDSGATVVDLDGRLLTPIGANPEVILVSQEPERKYRVTYRGDVPTNWVYCPDCQRALFQNMIINSVYLEQEFKCGRCKSTISFIFISNQFIPHL